MPSKGKRAAARHAHLSQRKRRGGKHPVARPPSQGVVAPAPETSSAVREEKPSAELVKAPVIAPAPTPTRSPQLQQIYPYVTRELRRIGLLSGLIIAILVALTLLLRG